VPKGTTKVAIYRDGVRVGYATKVYDDPGRLELAARGFTWKIVEFFNCKSERPTQSLHALGDWRRVLEFGLENSEIRVTKDSAVIEKLLGRSISD
jgi:hypothetical protein